MPELLFVILDKLDEMFLFVLHRLRFCRLDLVFPSPIYICIEKKMMSFSIQMTVRHTISTLWIQQGFLNYAATMIINSITYWIICFAVCEIVIKVCVRLNFYFVPCVWPIYKYIYIHYIGLVQFSQQTSGSTKKTKE